jgi:phage terminase small subunit
MNAKQARFVQEYLVDRVGAAAAVRAGYSSKTARQIGHRLLTHVDIAEAVREGESEFAAKAQLTRASVLQGLQEAIELGRSRADPAAMIAGRREIAKMYGFYAPERKQIELSATGLAVRVRLEDMNDAELTNLVAAGELVSG